MDDVPALHFARTARLLGVAAQAAGLRAPAFRSPPGVPGAARTIRRRPGGDVVAVHLRGRPPRLVEEDMVEGVVVANGLSGPAAERVRRALRAAVGADGTGVPDGTDGIRESGVTGAATGAGAPDAGPLSSPPARVAERQTQAA